MAKVAKAAFIDQKILAIIAIKPGIQEVAPPEKVVSDLKKQQKAKG